MIMAKSVHTMLRVLDEAKSVHFYQEAFGLNVKDRYAFDDFTLVYLKNDEIDFEVELTINHGRTEAYTHGTGYGHLALTVSDIESDHKYLEKLGFNPNPIKEFHRDGSLMAKFFFVTDPDGYKIEVLQRHGRFT
jgi:lactoylglutathione lyase